MNGLAGLKMPVDVIVTADFIVGAGRVLKNRHGAVGQADESSAPGAEVALKDGKCIWDSRDGA